MFPMKTRILAPALICVIAAFTGGCAYRVALTPEAAAQLKASAVSGVVALERDEIGLSIGEGDVASLAGVMVAMPPGLGFIGGAIYGATASLATDAINRSSGKELETIAAGIREGTLGYAFDQALMGAFSRRFASAGDGVPALSAVVVSGNTTVAEISRLVQEADGDAVALVFAKHLMTPSFSDFALEADVVLCAKSDALRVFAAKKFHGNQRVAVLYRNAFHSYWRIPADDWPEHSSQRKNAVRKANAAVWAKDNGARLRTALDSAAAEMAELIFWDLGNPAREVFDKDFLGGSATVQTKKFKGNVMRGVEGTAYRRVNNRVWMRSFNGCVYAQAE